MGIFLVRYVLKTKEKKECGKIVFVTEKTGVKRNNYYFALNTETSETEKVAFDWVKKNIELICNARICGTRLYYHKHKNSQEKHASLGEE